MLIFPDPNVETEYTDPNGSVWEFNGTGWVRQCDCSDGGDGGGNPDVEPPDEHWAETYLLINCDDLPDGSQEIVDATGKHTLTIGGKNGYPKVDTNTPKYGTGAVAFHRNNTSRIEVPMFDVRQHWTVEAWVNFGVVGGGTTSKHTLFSNWNLNGSSFALWVDSGKWSAKLNWSGEAGIDHTLNAGSGSATADGEYQHIALSWDGVAYRLWVDGELGAVIGQSKSLTRTSGLNLGIGSCQNSGTGGWQNYLNGIVDDIRITEGHCRYTVPFTPPLKLSTEPAIKMPLILREVGDELVFTDNDVPLKTNDVPLTTDIDLT